MTYQAKDYSPLLGMEGFSDELLKDHFELYEGYVSQTNELQEKLADLRQSEADSNEFAELKRRLGWEFNGMRLHELYFSNLGGAGTSPDGDLKDGLKSTFGSVDAWRDEFTAVAGLRGVGWAILYHDAAANHFMNLWIDEHATYHPTGCTPLLVLDVWEHAFVRDYGTDRDSYIDAFMQNIDWARVGERLAFTTSPVTVS